MEQATIIERLRARGITESAVSDADLGTLIEQALDWYSYYRPNYKFTTTSDCLTTVAGQAAYDPPDGALWVVAVFWQPGLSTSDLNSLYSSMIGCAWDPDHYADIIITLDQLSRVNRLLHGHWSIIDGRIVLSPVPTESDIQVPVLYATARTLSDLNSVADVWFEELVYGMALQRQAMNQAAVAGWRAGAYQVSAQAGKVMLDYANRVIEQARQAIARNYTAMRDDLRQMPSE